MKDLKLVDDACTNTTYKVQLGGPDVVHLMIFYGLLNRSVFVEVDCIIFFNSWPKKSDLFPILYPIVKRVRIRPPLKKIKVKTKEKNTCINIIHELLVIRCNLLVSHSSDNPSCEIRNSYLLDHNSDKLV